jgi:hypothetical protein
MSAGIGRAPSECTLDSDLDLLCAREWDTAGMPLAITRFVENSEADRPSSAMKMAVDSLMVEYSNRHSSVSPSISVEGLCEVYGAGLVGKRPKGRKADCYSTNQRPRVAHTGKLYFEGLRPTIRIPEDLDWGTTRVSVAHELGHLIIHRRSSGYDHATLRLPSSAAEEALAEYCARLLLIPSNPRATITERENLAKFALTQSGEHDVTLHSAVLRLGDPDIIFAGVRGAILWNLNSRVPTSEPISERITPRWHLCPRVFVPVGKCKARNGSLVAELADSEQRLGGTKVEEVRIGTFVGSFRIDAFAWGSIEENTRLILSVFREL